jgi:hypothetical protein
MARLILAIGFLCAAAFAADATAEPKPFFQSDYFGEMARAFGYVQKADLDAKTLTVKLEHDGKLVTVPILDDTELHIRDSWGELDDYFPGQRVLLFVYVDENRKWTYPRAVQDDIHFRSGHKRYAKVLSIDAATRQVKLEREEKNNKGETKTFAEEFVCSDDVKIWKGPAPAGFDALQPGDSVIHQLVEREGKIVATEIYTADGTAAVRNAQEARHRADQDKLGLVAYVNDVEILNGALSASVAWSGSNREKELKVGTTVCVSPAATAFGGENFAAQLCSIQPVDVRQRLQFLINSRVAARLKIGQSLRIFLPGTGPAIPEGRTGIPVHK